MSVQGLLVVDHGSRRAASNDQLFVVADMLRAIRPQQPVAAAHMEIAEPGIAHAFDELVAAGATEIVILLYFLSDGRHVTEDVPELVEEAAAKHPHVTWRMSRSLGPCEDLAHLLAQTRRAHTYCLMFLDRKNLKYRVRNPFLR